MKKDGRTACAFPVDSDFVGVTPKVVDVLLDPFQGLNLIQETDVIIRDRPTGEVRVGEEPESCQTVVNGYNDDFLALVDPVIEGEIGGIPVDIAPTVNVN